MKKPVLKAVLLAVAVLMLYGTYLAVRAHSDLVTLDVRDMEVRDVVKKIEWQTWESIFVHQGVEGKITLKVEKVPLEEVLNLIDEQASTRWTAVYPLYSSGKSLVAFKKSLRGDVNPSESGWTNYTTRGFFGGFGGGPGGFGSNVRNQNSLVSMQVVNKELPVVTRALARYAQAQVVPEDGTLGTVQLSLNQVPMPEAVKQVAAQVKRKWTKYYVLNGERGFRRGGGDVAEGDRGTNEFRRGPGGFEPTPEQRAEFERRFQEQLDTMTPEERAKAEERRKQMEAMRNMSPEDRRKAFEQMAQSPEFKSRMENRMLNGIKNTTPEQRQERAQRMEARRARREGQQR